MSRTTNEIPLADIEPQAVITIPNSILKQKSKRVGYIDDSITHLAATMIATALEWEKNREHEFSAALAAVQIAELYRVVVVREDFEDKSNRRFTVLINPEIVKTDGEPIEELEGCLSVSDIYGAVSRFPKVKVKALNLEGREVRLTATDFLARVLQHEIDHTNGTVFVDRITDPKKLFKLLPNGQFAPLTPEDATP